MGIIFQDVNLFTGTVMDNIQYGKLDATDKECIAAAKLSGADSYVSQLPDEYQTMINGDNNNLSQGQCQLISIARAAVANPPVMIIERGNHEQLIEQRGQYYQLYTGAFELE